MFIIYLGKKTDRLFLTRYKARKRPRRLTRARRLPNFSYPEPGLMDAGSCRSTRSASIVVALCTAGNIQFTYSDTHTHMLLRPIQILTPRFPARCDPPSLCLSQCPERSDADGPVHGVHFRFHRLAVSRNRFLILRLYTTPRGGTKRTGDGTELQLQSASETWPYYL
jgi:hypothetical protein